MKLEDVYEAHGLVERLADLEKAQENIPGDEPVALSFSLTDQAFSVDREVVWSMLDEEIDSIEVRLKEMGVELPEKKQQEEQGDAPVGFPSAVQVQEPNK